MGARKNAMIRKAKGLIDFGYNATYRDMMKSYRFWKNLERVGGLKYGSCGYYKNHFAGINLANKEVHQWVTR